MAAKVLTTGICVSPGIVKGRAKVIKKSTDLDSVKYGDILILPNSHPMYAIAVMKASAVICENGGKLSHICVVSMEMGIPCITQAEDAGNRIEDGQTVYIDASEGVVYDG